MLTLFLHRGAGAYHCADESWPDFFFVSQTAVSRSRKEAMMGVLGITCGVMVWAGVALLGLHLIIEKMAWLHTIIMVGGGLYLCWMGYQMLRGALKEKAATSRAAG
jgi:threonine efflux protein